MKKLLGGVATLGLALAVVPLVTAFEAHIINVTAEIENALAADVYSIDFGTVFPQEKFDKQFSIGFSESFTEDGRFDDVEYVLRQKPKCMINVTGLLVIPSLPQFGQAKEDEDGNFICKDEVNYDLMPFLCPYLSKAEITPEPAVEGAENDMKDPSPGSGHTGPLAAFHGPILLASTTNPGGWDMDTTLAYQLLGRLAKSDKDTSDTWNIDLKVPCFTNHHCAQDWNDFVAANDGDNKADPDDYIQPIENEHKIFGCDLWLEVTELSLPPNTATVSVFKVVVNDNGGTATSTAFTINVTGTNPLPPSFPGDSGGTLVVLEPGPYSIGETPLAGYTKTGMSADCIGVIAAGENKICVITNNDNAATLTVIKHTINNNAGTTTSGGFTMNVTGTNVSDPSFTGEEAPGTAVTLDPGPYTVTEDGTNASRYTSSQSIDCVGSIAAGESKTCTITNDDKPGTLIVKKVLINDDGGFMATTTFSFKVNGAATTTFEADAQNDITVGAGTYTVVENPAAGYVTTYQNCTSVFIPNGGTATCTVTNNDIEEILACNAELDLMLVLDRSGSISSTELQTLKTAAHSFVDTLTPSTAGVHIGQTSFSTAATLDLHLTDDEAAAHLAINALTAGGSTDLEAGITLAIAELDNLHVHERAGEPDALVVITDGEPNIPNATQGPIDAAAAADAARAAGIEVFVVGVGVSTSTEAFLKADIADDAAHYFAAADFDGLDAKLKELVACDKKLKMYTYAGVTTANDGNGIFPIAFEHDSDVWPWLSAADENSSTTPDNGEYDDIETDNNVRWNSANPGGGDFMVKQFRFFISTTTQPLANITDVKVTWKGQPDTVATTTVWLHKTGTSDYVAANWVQLGAGFSIPSDTDRYIVRHLSSGFATYVAASGRIDVMIAIDNDNEVLRTDYVQLLVTSTP